MSWTVRGSMWMGGHCVMSGRRRHAAAGDKSVDGVDNSAAQPSDKHKDGPMGEPSNAAAPNLTGPNPTGPDLARAALESAKQAAKARGRTPAKRRASTGAGRGHARRRGWSGPRPDDRDPQPLGWLATRIAADRGWTEQLSGGAVFGRWPELVGADIAEHATPVSLRDGELTVQAVSTAWATQLRLLQRDLLRKIAAGAGRGAVTRLRIHGPSAPSWRHGSRHVPGRGPRDTYG
jgi:predicted nucleic acid-binding Zn ribbon protein